MARWRETVNEMLCKTFGYEGLEGEEKPESSDSAKLVNWQTEKMAQI